MANYPATLPSATPADHGVVIDELRAMAALGTFSFIYESGFWYVEPSTTTGTAPGTGSLQLSRYSFAPGTTLVGLAEFVTSGVATAVRRLCIYADSNGYPGALLRDAGTYDASTGGWKQAGGADFAATAVGGAVWMGGVSTVAASTIGFTNSRGRSVGFSSIAALPANNNPWEGYTQTGVTGALPDPFTSTRTVAATTPRIAFKIG